MQMANKHMKILSITHYSDQIRSVAQSCPTLWDPMNRSTPGLPVHHQLPEFTQTHVHQVGDAIQPSHPLSSPSPPAPNPSQHQSLFQWVNSAWGGQSTGVSALASFLPKKSQGWSPSEWTGWISLQSRGLSRVFSNTTVQKHQFFGTQFSLWSSSHIHTWLTLTRWTFVGKLMSLLFNMPSRLVIVFLPRSKHLSISWLQSPSAVILEPPKIKSVNVFTVSPSFAMKWWDWMPWSSSTECCFKPAFSLSSFTFIKRHFSYSLISGIRVVSSAYLRWLIFLPAILITACASSSPAFLMMFSAYKLNKQGDNIQPWRTPFPIWNQSVVPCPVLTVVPDLHIGFSRGRSGDVVFPSLSEFSTVYCDPHSQRLWHSQ